MSNETEQLFILTPSTSQPSTSSQKILVELPETTQVNLENVKDFSNVCRVCATITEFVIPIFEGEGQQNNLADKIHKHLPIQVSQQDVLPRVVCYQCASTLLAWHELVQCCQQANDALRARLARDQESKIMPNTQKPNTEEDTQVKLYIEKQDIKTELDGETEPNIEHIELPNCVTIGDDGKKYATCRECNKTVPMESWRRHARCHKHEKRYSCHTCGLAFNDSGNLSRHRRALHAKQRPHACLICSKSFSRNSHLMDHMKSHSESRDYVCDLCGKGSKSSAALRMHRKTHDACRFRCMECGAEFKRRGELRAHVTVHTGEKAHLCGCGRAFRLKSQLTAHARTHAKES